MLPPFLNNKRATINPQNNDQYCFKWAILAKHVTGPNKHRVGVNYYQHEHKYNFSGITFPTPWCEVKVFEKNNPGVSVNVYGVKKISLECNHIFPLKVVDNEKANHFDIILFSDGKKVTMYIFPIFHFLFDHKLLYTDIRYIIVNDASHHLITNI
jgi:hypothetical protein